MAAQSTVGVLGGYVLLRWMTATTIPSVLPEIGFTATLFVYTAEAGSPSKRALDLLASWTLPGSGTGHQHRHDPAPEQ